MSILQLTIAQKRLSSAEAEIWISVRVNAITESTVLRGSLVGPKCPDVETVQIMYSLKPIDSDVNQQNVLMGRIVVPEPNVWTPEQPFVYEGNVELWQEGKCAEIKPIRAAFKGRAET
jgi:hypothetical protein